MKGLPLPIRPHNVADALKIVEDPRHLLLTASIKQRDLVGREFIILPEPLEHVEPAGINSWTV
jgi:hypothetical protein